MPAAAAPSMSGRLTAVPLALSAVLSLPLLLVLAALMGSGSGVRTGESVPDIPDEYLALYQEVAHHYRLGVDGWSVLAAVGNVECDHGRSHATGCDRGEANSAGARGPAQFLPRTWAEFGVDADGDGDRDVYDPADAIFGMGNYLRASGAPANWRHALFSYNHATWYVEKVLSQAADYRASLVTTSSEPGKLVTAADEWLVPLPGFPGERCDARIVPDVTALARAFGLEVTDCFGGAPHELNGEHPLGLAIDAAPADGDWRRTDLLARRFGWRVTCAATGCPGAGPFRVILYNGFPHHGDPRHSDRPHIHLSWQHGPAAPFTPAPWVRVIVGSTAGSRRAL